MVSTSSVPCIPSNVHQNYINAFLDLSECHREEYFGGKLNEKKIIDDNNDNYTVHMDVDKTAFYLFGSLERLNFRLLFSHIDYEYNYKYNS